MPRQNRVTPFGQIVGTPERGTMMGNRGVLHDAEGRILRPWQVKRWLICLLEFKGRHRAVMTPSRYTELFFLDEATGLADGHRPCYECRRARFLAFRDAWATGRYGAVPPDIVKAGTIDDRLQAERVGPGRTKRTFTANLDEVPDGVFVNLEGRGDEAHLIWKRGLLAWSLGGYTGRRPRRRGQEVTVLTPRATVAAIRSGYEPEVHHSVFTF
jgi:hypothetical protein